MANTNLQDPLAFSDPEDVSLLEFGRGIGVRVGGLGVRVFG